MTGAENRDPLFGIIKSLLRMIRSENRDPLFGIMRLTLPVQDGDRREQPAGGFEVDPDLAIQPFLQGAGTFIVDAAAAHVDGLDLVRGISARHKGLPVLVLTMHEAPLHVRRAFAAGASGYVTKRDMTETLLEAIRSVLRGEKYGAPKN